MRQEELDKLFVDTTRSGLREKGELDFVHRVRQLGGRIVENDWRQQSVTVEGLLRVLTDHGFTVLRDPRYRGVVSCGYVVFSATKPAQVAASEKSRPLPRIPRKRRT